MTIHKIANQNKSKDNGTIDASNIFLEHFGEEPRHIFKSSIQAKIGSEKVDNIIDALSNISNDAIVYSSMTHNNNDDDYPSVRDDDSDETATHSSKNKFFNIKNMKLKTLNVVFTNKIASICINAGQGSTYNITIFTMDRKHPLIDKIVDVLNSLLKNSSISKKSEIYFICYDGSLYAQEIKINYDSKIKLEQLYNDDFMDVSAHLIKNLKKNKGKGVAFLHGEPGTGKTTYLRYLVSKIHNKKIIYLTNDIMTRVSSPDFLAFLLSYKNSIIILEDAETIIKARSADSPNDSVSTLLNLSDGFIGDALNFQIICTFNAELKDVDPALLRQGRLITNYKFDKLSLEKTNSLFKSLKVDYVSDKPMVLSEIFAKKADSITLVNETKEEEKSALGFNLGLN